jgi:hypothetical protein
LARLPFGLGSGGSEAAGSSGSARIINLTGSSAGTAGSGSAPIVYRTQPANRGGASGSSSRHSALVSRAAAAITVQPVAAGTRMPSAGTADMVGAPATLQVPVPVVAPAPVGATVLPHSTSTTTSAPASDPTASGSGASEISASIPAGRDGTWIVPPLPGLNIDGSLMPDVPGLATGPAPVGDLLALGPQGTPDAFDVTTRTWILTPPSSKYVPGMGYESDGSKATVVVSASSDTASSSSTGTSSGGVSNVSSAAVGPDGRWVVTPKSMGSDSSGNVLPDLPGLAMGPAPAGDVLALGPAGAEFAFDVTTRTWIMTPDSSTYTYRNGIGFVSTATGS